jgi:hypothetical protein
MLHIRKVIQKISEEDSVEFVFWLKQNDAAKCAQLFSLMRETKQEESAIAAQLLVSPSAFYALKSRLNGKIQDFLAHNVPDINIDLLKRVANIPGLLFNSPKEIAISHLLKMEKELIENDLPYSLITVYGALKKLHRYSQKYFDYSKLYNKHLAYMMTIDKAQDLLVDFNKTIGEFQMSHDQRHLDILKLLQIEMHNCAQLYDSHRLTVYKNIMDVEFALFVADLNQREAVAIDEILLKTEQIIRSQKNDMSYRFLTTLINFLWYKYYSQHHIQKKEAEYFFLVNEKLSVFLLNNFYCFPSVFLLSKVRKYLESNEEQKLYSESKTLFAAFTPDIEDVPNYINYIKFQAIAAFYSGKYSESISLLNELLNTINFINFPHAEIEIKLFLALCGLLVNKIGVAEILVKNIQRKLRDLDSGVFANAGIFAKILSLSIAPKGKETSETIILMRDQFHAVNARSAKMLDYIRLDDAFLKTLSKKVQYSL